MGYRPIKTCADAARHGFFLEITCGKCGRIGIFDPASFFGTRWYSVGINRLAARMRCDGSPGGPQGCGARGATLRFVSWPPTPPKIEIPKPVATPAPRGVDQAAWDRADERERKRLIRQARG